MGIIYTWKEIRYRKIPGLQDFVDVKEVLFEELSENEHVVSAVLCGSVARGDFDKRSDVDCVVIYDTDHEKEVMDELRALTCSALSDNYIRINFVPVDSILAQTRMHHIGGSFREHVIYCAQSGGLIKGNVEQSIAPSLDTKQEVLSYLRVKVYTLTEGYAGYYAFDYHKQINFLKKVLEAPMHIARKMLYYRDMLSGDSKKAVLDQYRQIATEDQMYLLGALCHINSVYTSDLEFYTSGQRSKTDYDQVLEGLAEAIFMSVQFARLNLLSVVESP